LREQKKRKGNLIFWFSYRFLSSIMPITAIAIMMATVAAATA
jgi:hypothetical protein